LNKLPNRLSNKLAQVLTNSIIQVTDIQLMDVCLS